jgi:hypothetical protein
LDRVIGNWIALSAKRLIWGVERSERTKSSMRQLYQSREWRLENELTAITSLFATLQGDGSLRFIYLNEWPYSAKQSKSRLNLPFLST